MKSVHKLYRFHTENLRSVSAALDQIALSHRAAIAKGNQPGVDTFTRLYATLLGAWAECRLAKLLYHPHAYSETDRQLVREQGKHLDRWHKVVELAFRKHYCVPNARLSADILPHSANSRRESLIALLDGDLSSIITLRNKLAHGQWVYPLNDTWDDVSQAQMDALRRENLQSLQFKRSLINSLLDAIADLAMSPPTFERDFDKHFHNIQNCQRNLRTRSYAKYVASLQIKYRRRR